MKVSMGKLFALMLLVISCPFATAQQLYCPASVPSGHPLCVPVSEPAQAGHSGPEVSRRATTISFPRYGAIAVDAETGISSSSENKRSAEEASARAIKACAKGRRMHQCKVGLIYANECAALAWPDGKQAAPPISMVGATTQEAETAALRECSIKGGDCVMIYSGCSLPSIKNYD